MLIVNQFNPTRSPSLKDSHCFVFVVDVVGVVVVVDVVVGGRSNNLFSSDAIHQEGFRVACCICWWSEGRGPQV